MDFTPTTGQQDAAALAREILRDRCTAERLTEVETAGDRFDRELWSEIGRAGLVGLALPEGDGGSGPRHPRARQRARGGRTRGRSAASGHPRADGDGDRPLR